MPIVNDKPETGRPQGEPGSQGSLVPDDKPQDAVEIETEEIQEEPKSEIELISDKLVEDLKKIGVKNILFMANDPERGDMVTLTGSNCWAIGASKILAKKVKSLLFFVS